MPFRVTVWHVSKDGKPCIEARSAMFRNTKHAKRQHKTFKNKVRKISKEDNHLTISCLQKRDENRVFGQNISVLEKKCVDLSIDCWQISTRSGKSLRTSSKSYSHSIALKGEISARKAVNAPQRTRASQSTKRDPQSENDGADAKKEEHLLYRTISRETFSRL